MTDIRKFMKLVEYGEINPARPVDRDEAGRVLHPDVSYEVSPDKVVATLKSYNSQTFTKLAQKIERVTELEREATTLREEVKQMGREQIADLFAADDAVRTRIIDTVSFVMKLTKDPKAAETVKYAKVIEELESKLTPELLTVMQGIVKKYTTTQAAKPAALSFEPKATESAELSEGVWDKIKSVLAKFKDAILSWGNKYDAQLDALKAQVAMAESVEETAEVDEANISDLRSGWTKSKDAAHDANRVRGGHQTLTIGRKEYIPGGSVKSTQLKVGDKFMNTYNSYNQGVDAYELVGFNTDSKDEATFSSLKELAATVGGAKNMKELEEKAGHVYMVVKDLEDGSQGAYLYLFQGRWCRGSGAERVTFTILKDATTESEELDEYEHVGKDFVRPAPVSHERDVLPTAELVSSWKSKTNKFYYVWRSVVGGTEGVLIDGKGKKVTMDGLPTNIEALEDILANTFNLERVKTQELSLADSEQVEVDLEGDEQGLTEYGEPAEDGFPVAATLSDEELVSYMKHWSLVAKAIDPTTESGAAFMAFGDELRAECEERSLAC